jgi:hypothetical protein
MSGERCIGVAFILVGIALAFIAWSQYRQGKMVISGDLGLPPYETVERDDPHFVRNVGCSFLSAALFILFGIWIVSLF